MSSLFSIRRLYLQRVYAVFVSPEYMPSLLAGNICRLCLHGIHVVFVFREYMSSLFAESICRLC